MRDMLVYGTAGLICPKCGTKLMRKQFIQSINKVWEHVTCLVIASSNGNPTRTEDRAKLLMVKENDGTGTDDQPPN